MKIPFERPVSGSEIPRDFFGKLWDYLKATQVSGDGKHILVTRTAAGTTIKFKEQPDKHESSPGGGGDAYYRDQFYLCRLTGNYDASKGYEATVFFDNIPDSQNSAVTYIRFTVSESALPTTLAGRYVLARIFSSVVFGGLS